MNILESVWLTSNDGALETLRQRYARGEIDRDEYVAKERDLKGGGR